MERDGTSRFIVATHTVKELKKQEIPAHIAVTSKKRRGPRTAPPRSRPLHNAQRVLARWPQDAQEAVAMPTLLYVIRGQADIHIADYLLQCQTGDFLLIPPGVPQPTNEKPHIHSDDPERSCDLLWLCPRIMGVDTIACWICHSKGSQHYSNYPREFCWMKNPFIVRLFEGICDELQNGSKEYVLFHLLVSLIYLVRREIEQDRVFLSDHRSQFIYQAESSDPIEHACAYINSHLAHPLTIQRVARHCYLAPATFTRKFREKKGQSFNEYVRARRMEEAALLLRNTSWSAARVSAAVGLQYAQLRRLFLQYHGCAPGEFRQRKF